MFLLKLLGAALSVPAVAVLGCMLLCGRVLNIGLRALFSVITLSPLKLVGGLIAGGFNLIKFPVQFAIALVVLPMAIVADVGWGPLKWVAADALGLTMIRGCQPVADMMDMFANAAEGMETAFRRSPLPSAI